MHKTTVSSNWKYSPLILQKLTITNFLIATSAVSSFLDFRILTL